MNNCELVKKLSIGYTVSKIAKDSGYTIPSLQKRIYILRERTECKTVAHLVSYYLRKGLID